MGAGAFYCPYLIENTNFKTISCLTMSRQVNLKKLYFLGNMREVIDCKFYIYFVDWLFSYWD